MDYYYIVIHGWTLTYKCQFTQEGLSKSVRTYRTLLAVFSHGRPAEWTYTTCVNPRGLDPTAEAQFPLWWPESPWLRFYSAQTTRGQAGAFVVCGLRVRCHTSYDALPGLVVGNDVTCCMHRYTWRSVRVLIRGYSLIERGMSSVSSINHPISITFFTYWVAHTYDITCRSCLWNTLALPMYI